jgi:hypothetical protein
LEILSALCVPTGAGARDEPGENPSSKFGDYGTGLGWKFQ